MTNVTWTTKPVIGVIFLIEIYTEAEYVSFPFMYDLYIG